VLDITKLPYPDNSIEQIESYHVIEHLPRHNLERALRDWYRVLNPGGKLILECPDFDEIAKLYLAGDEKQLDGIFGLQRFEGDYHLFGYNRTRLSTTLKRVGFANIENKPPQDYHSIEWSCLRVECTKNE
jgi:predicted SAM-dependent methyltransferase